jgi:hypothetical protein
MFESNWEYVTTMPKLGPNICQKIIFYCTFQFTFLELVLIEALRFATIRGWHSTRYPLIFTTASDHTYTSSILIVGSGFMVRKLCFF